MKKLISLLLTITICLGSFAVAVSTEKKTEKTITKKEAYQFADELKKMNLEEYDVSSRLIVSSNKDIDYLNAMDVATGIEGLYVLQFPNAETANEAYDYYNSLSYVNYVEYDVECENTLCSIDSENVNLQNTYTKNDFDFIPDCPSTVNQNIDDAIKLLKRENIEMPEIRVGVIDSGVSKIKITEDVLEDGYSFLEGYSENGTDDRYGHGTKVAGTIIINSVDNIKLLPFQVYDSSGCSNLSNVVTAIYLGVSENCKILNCSIGIKTAVLSTKNAFEEAVNYAVSQGCICVASAGNDNVNLSETNQLPASVKNSIAVGAITQKNKITSFSNFGDGVDIYATGFYMTSYDNNGSKVTNWLGTSAAAPVISSICVLLITAKPDITVDEIKQLLIETGYSFNEENQSDKDRIIADAYGCVKKLLGKELEQVDLDYTITKDETTGCSDISFSSNDKNVKIYYELGLGSLSEIPYKEMTGASQYEYKLGKTIKLSKWQKITVAAYAPGKEKKVLEFSAPTYTNEGGYRLTESSKTQQYNKIDRCQFIDEKVIEVPETINGIEIQEIGDWCFIGNKTVEKIILPESVKRIDYYAFANCPNLKEVIAPGVETCGMYAFSDCKNLVNVEMPNVTVANTGMFKNCTSLETAKLGTLTEIDNHAFYGCENLKLVKTSNDDISFAVNTFKDCKALTICTPKDSSMYTFAVNNDIPVITSLDELNRYYSFSHGADGVLTYENTVSGETIQYSAGDVFAQWDVKYINQSPDDFDDGYLFDLIDDDIINAKDYAMLFKLAADSNQQQV